MTGNTPGVRYHGVKPVQHLDIARGGISGDQYGPLGNSFQIGFMIYFVNFPGADSGRGPLPAGKNQLGVEVLKIALDCFNRLKFTNLQRPGLQNENPAGGIQTPLDILGFLKIRFQRHPRFGQQPGGIII